jgi:predicted DNA-binding protein
MKKIEDPNSTTMTVRLSVESKEMWKRLAERDHRTVANYLDFLLKRIEQKDFCLADVMDQLDVIKTMLKPKEKKETKKKDRFDELYMMDITGNDGLEIMERGSWMEWIDHLRKMGVRVNEYALEKHANLFKEHYADGWNIDYLVADLIKRGAKSIYIHADLHKM